MTLPWYALAVFVMYKPLKFFMMDLVRSDFGPDVFLMGHSVAVIKPIGC